MPIDVVAREGLPDSRRWDVEQAVETAGRRLPGVHEAWVVPARAGGGFCVRITGPDGFFCQTELVGDETEAEIKDKVMRALEP
ncbi:MAG: hypothetical protein LAQ69_14220 [Acidobacteriia bacterium]|nr:hypothetical protein [Terriglobia bacterium]